MIVRKRKPSGQQLVVVFLLFLLLLLPMGFPTMEELELLETDLHYYEQELLQEQALEEQPPSELQPVEEFVVVDEPVVCEDCFEDLFAGFTSSEATDSAEFVSYQDSPEEFSPPEEDAEKPKPIDSFKEYLEKIAKKPVCPKGFDAFGDFEAGAFPKYRAEAAKAFYEILEKYNKGDLTRDQLREALMIWYRSYVQRYANCGERAKLSAAVAAYLGFETYDCGRKNGDHEFAIVVIDGQAYIVEPWPDNVGNSLTACTLVKDGKALKPPFSVADLAGAEVRVGDTVQETIGSCNQIYRPAQ